MPIPERETFPRAIVPEHLTARTIGNLPPDEPVAIPLFQDTADYYKKPTLLVDGNRNLRVRTSTEVLSTPVGSAKSPLGRAGIMRIALIGNDAIQIGIVADLRFLKKPIFELGSEAPEDVEEARDWWQQQEESIIVNAFIANDPNSYNGAYYGPEEFYPALNRLRKHGNKTLQNFQRYKRSRNSNKNASDQKSATRQSSSSFNSPNDTS